MNFGEYLGKGIESFVNSGSYTGSFSEQFVLVLMCISYLFYISSPIILFVFTVSVSSNLKRIKESLEKLCKNNNKEIKEENKNND